MLLSRAAPQRQPTFGLLWNLSFYFSPKIRAKAPFKTHNPYDPARRASGFLLRLLSKPPRTEFTCFRQDHIPGALPIRT
jgi:hypothetical protein